ncbi:MAG TPA: glutamine synthetase family protein [Rugosibacter sp.]|nr:glutamine synthetase family protein [Rugosibacter sp.]HQN46461.1 glutamine synthetase family protein [Rugosibacter sp.]HQQ35743.1 glutamine synthetase family protein [Rugosibacter sp.]
MADMKSEELARKVASTAVGRTDFISRTAADTAERRSAIEKIQAVIKEKHIDVVRVCFVDTQGQVRLHAIQSRHFAQAARNGVAFTSVLLAMDSANLIYQNVFSADGGFGNNLMGGAGDMLALPDPATFRLLPWAPQTAWVLSDLYLTNGERCPFDPRWAMQKACAALEEKNMRFLGGAEVEFHVFKITDPHLSLEHCTQPGKPPSVMALSHGYQYMNDQITDAMDPIINPLRSALLAMQLPLRTLETEWGPGQLEVTLDPLVGIDAADAVIMLRTTIKQVARRLGYVASFMAKPNLPNVFAIGWHLHQSLADKTTGRNLFAADDALLSDIGRYYVGGLLQHVRAGAAFSNPTINGYKRLNANPLSPKRAVWSVDNKAAMCRLVGGNGDPSTRIENRIGEPAANPYLYMASQIFSGLDGISTQKDPGPPLNDNPYAQTHLEAMPASLLEAVDALATSEMLKNGMGKALIDHFIGQKKHEIGRFMSAVTDWEHTEYFEMF